MKKKLISILTIVALLFSSTIVYANTHKDETVYVMLENDGKVSNIKVVNHLYGDGDVYTDYGEYKKIVNLVDNREPKVSGNKIEWPTSDKKDFYFEGEIEKDLPLKLDISYYLDGNKIEAERLSGKKGKLKIDIDVNFTQEAESYNMMAQIQVPLDLDIFKNIKSEGSKVVVGREATIAFVAISPEKRTFTIEADGEDISLKPMTITLTPADSLIPEDIGGEFDSLTQGLGDIDDGMTKLGSGLDESIDGTKKLEDGTKKLGQGLNELHGATSEIDSQTGRIAGGLDQFQGGLRKLVDSIQNSGTGELIGGMNKLYNGLNELSQNGKQIHQGIDSAHKGLQQASGGITAEVSKIVGGIEEYETRHQQLVASVDELAKALEILEDSPDPEMQGIAHMAKGLAGGMRKQTEGIAGIKMGIEEFGTGVTKGIKPAAQGLGQLSENYGQYQQGVVTMRDSLGEFMGALPEGANTPTDGLEQMVREFNTLKDGINKIFGGYGEVNKGLGQIKNSTEEISGGLNALAGGQGEIRDGLNTLNTEGVRKMRTELDDSIGQILGDGENSGSYTSFVDNDKNKNSNVQFIMRTPGVAKMEEAEKTEDTPKADKNIFQRFLELFR